MGTLKKHVALLSVYEFHSNFANKPKLNPSEYVSLDFTTSDENENTNSGRLATADQSCVVIDIAVEVKLNELIHFDMNLIFITFVKNLHRRFNLGYMNLFFITIVKKNRHRKF